MKKRFGNMPMEISIIIVNIWMVTLKKDMRIKVTFFLINNFVYLVNTVREFLDFWRPIDFASIGVLPQQEQPQPLQDVRSHLIQASIYADTGNKI